MFTKNSISQSMIDAVNKVIDEKKEESVNDAQQLDEASPVKIPTATGTKVLGTRYGNSAKAHKDQTKSAVDTIKGPKSKEMQEDKNFASKLVERAKCSMKKEEIDPDVRTKDTLAGRVPTDQKDDVGPGADGKSTKVKYRGGPMMTKEDTDLMESHFKIGDKVKFKDGGMEGEVVKLDKPHGEDDEEYYTVKREDGKTMKCSPEDLTLVKEEASYSAKAARAGKDIGKPGKMFSKIAASAAKKYGSKERGEKVAGAVLAKLRSEGFEAEDISEEYADALVEAFEQLEERSMTDAEMKKREEIVKSMKKGFAGFRERYGKRAKDVMYATATKQAMKEEEEIDEALKGDQHKIDVNKNKKIDADDFKLLRAGKKPVKEAMQKADVPAYLRKQKGEKPLTVADVKDPRPDSISHPANLAKARNEEVGQVEEGMMKRMATDDEEDKRLSKTPFDKPYTTSKGTVTDKSGAKHTPMSRAKDLARAAMKKIKQETMMGKAGTTSESKYK